MKSSDIPNTLEFVRETFSFADLLERASSDARTSWTDLPKGAGIYAVYWVISEDPIFRSNTGKAKFAIATDPRELEERWAQINQRNPTDIIYIGKSVDIRRRVRQLAHFGVGKIRNHVGGEWMWQISRIESAKIMLQQCPAGKEIAFESWLLDEFKKEHKNWPIANRDGPEGDERWFPGKVEELHENFHKPSLTTHLVDRANDITFKSSVTLHGEIVDILREQGEEWLTAKQIAELVNKRGRYRKGDGSEMRASQISARVRKYPHLFDWDGPRLRLKK